MSDAEIGQYITWLRQTKPTPAERVARIAMKSIGQPYDENAPMFSHLQGNCVSFVDHTLAMALADSRESYLRLTARLRYADGIIPFQPEAFTIADYRLMPNNRADERLAMQNRNHFTLAQWLPNNRWCLDDITKQLGAGPIKPWIPLHHMARSKEFLAKQGLQVNLPEIKVVDAFVPREAVPQVLPELRSGDVVLVITGTWENRYCDHMALFIEHTRFDGISRDGPPWIVHSAPPEVRLESVRGFLRRFPDVQGLKFLRVKPDAEAAAAREDAVMARRMNVPSIQD